MSRRTLNCCENGVRSTKRYISLFSNKNRIKTRREAQTIFPSARSLSIEQLNAKDKWGSSERERVVILGSGRRPLTGYYNPNANKKDRMGRLRLCKIFGPL
jgi:hypothetical protein